MLLFHRTDNPIIVITLFHTYGWTQECLTHLRTFLPDVPLLIIDNNPARDDSPRRRASFMRHRSTYGVYSGFDRFCELESRWVQSVSNATIIKTPSQMYHGACLDMALDWCFKNKYGLMVHIEPDCMIWGTKWYENMLEAMREGYWMAGPYEFASKIIHPTPTVWSVNVIRELNISFLPASKAADYLHPRFHEIFNYNDNPLHPWEKEGWDTGLRAWFKCALRGKAKRTDAPDFFHFWNGTIKCKKEVLV